MERIKKRIRNCDWLVWVSFGLMLLVKFFTIFLFVQISEDTGAEITHTAAVYEANDILRIAASLGNIGYILAVIVLPAGLIAFYFYMRRKVLAGKVEINTLEFFVQFTFFALLINIVNDGSALLSKLVQ